MNNKTFLAIVLTSIFWVVVWFLNTPATESEQPSEATTDLAEKIVGAWVPEDERNIPLEFTRYGTICLGDEGGLASSMLKFNYKLDADKVVVEGYGLFSSEFRVKASADEQGDYLEIYDNPQLAGKYRKKDLTKPVATPKQSAPAKPRQQATRNNSQATQQQNSVVTKKPAALKAINYAEAIVGKWHPVEGAERPIEITKYGTIIQWYSERTNMRYDYSISGNKMKIKYEGTARVEVIQEGNNTYLEIYDVTKYSGKYRKVK